jgi:hypothetical protein
MKTIYYNEKQLTGPYEQADLVITDMEELADAVSKLSGSVHLAFGSKQ